MSWILRDGRNSQKEGKWHCYWLCPCKGTTLLDSALLRNILRTDMINKRNGVQPAHKHQNSPVSRNVGHSWELSQTLLWSQGSLLIRSPLANERRGATGPAFPVLCCQRGRHSLSLLWKRTVRAWEVWTSLWQEQGLELLPHGREMRIFLHPSQISILECIGLLALSRHLRKVFCCVSQAYSDWLHVDMAVPRMKRV